LHVLAAVGIAHVLFFQVFHVACDSRAANGACAKAQYGERVME
jgi:hypothetical protein